MSRSHDSKPHERYYTDFGAFGETPAFQYWNDFVSVYSNALQTESLRLIGLWQRAALSGYDPEGVGSLPGLWRSWLVSVANVTWFPYEWMMRRDATVPSIVFLVDQYAQSAGPQAAPTPIAAGGLKAGSTPLWSFTNPGAMPINPDQVDAQIICHGNRVQVTLVNLGQPAMVGQDPTPPRPTNILVPGVYGGLVFAWEQEQVNGRPLALVWVVVNQ